MIGIVFKKEKGYIVSYEIKGHADRMALSNEKYHKDYDSETNMIYNDVVCGSVSTIGQVCILGVLEVLKIQDAFYKAEDGDIALDLSNCSFEDKKKCSVLMKTTLIGLQNLEISYGEYIKVQVEEV
ncbi:ribosomal-processing cysteine protease Prp [Clostridium rectalis]|uniref:ribosomal-processing cysteine protease Prp n=1 Tax=Clostridium rectalis TaxID=2040295 RepID=UPI000F6337F7|nr:ribosomal-processing cysteine protease Prp [Clostridium rectalis]